MQLEIYSLTALKDQISVSLEAICDSYSSLLWDIEFYQCGCFEVYIAASPQMYPSFSVAELWRGAMMHSILASLNLCNWKPMLKRAIT